MGFGRPQARQGKADVVPANATLRLGPADRGYGFTAIMVAACGFMNCGLRAFGYSGRVAAVRVSQAAGVNRLGGCRQNRRRTDPRQR
jgi:hypothetical protein